jgi:nitrile hydratase beta subunit
VAVDDGRPGGALVNGPHDVGGLHGFGTVDAEPAEPVFHAEWEGRMLGIASALELNETTGYTGDEFRYAIERMGHLAYHGSSYYQRWLYAIERILAEKGLLDPAEVQERAAADPPRPPVTNGADDSETAKLLVDILKGTYPPGPPLDAGTPPRFAPGDAVRARNLQTRQHLRLPGYAKNHRGTIESHRGAFAHPEWRARHGEDRPVHQYTVRFEARDLWGDDAEQPGDAVYIDLFEDYLEPA